MSPSQRCDEILRIIDDVLAGAADPPARGRSQDEPAGAAETSGRVRTGQGRLLTA